MRIIKARTVNNEKNGGETTGHRSVEIPIVWESHTLKHHMKIMNDVNEETDEETAAAR